MKKLSLDELGRISVDEFKQADKLPVCVVLDNIRSLHNVGSAFRTADAFRLEKLVLAGITGTPPHREIHKTALGATESVAWHHEPSVETALRQLKAEGYLIVAVEQTTASELLHRFRIPKNQKLALVFGNEINGVSNEAITLTDVALEIPQHGTKHSLNVSVCLGIVVWEVYQQLLES